MNNPPKYNSQSLKEAFPEVYRDFFSTCATVVSAPGMFLWAGNFSLLAGSFGVTQNLPLRVYAGLEETMGGKVVFDRCFYWSSQDSHFINYEMNESIREELVNFLTAEIQKMIEPKKFKGLKIHILSELPIGSGVNASGALATDLACALFLYYRLILPETILALSKRKVAELLEEPLFSQLFRFAWKVEAIFHGGLTSGVGAFSPFLVSRAPVVYYIEPPAAGKSDRINFSCDIGQAADKNFDLIDRLAFGGFRLSELISGNNEFYFPFDFGLINTGIHGSSTIANRALKNLENNLGASVDFYQKELSSYLRQPSFKKLPMFDEIFSRGEINKVWEAFLLVISYISINIIFSLSKLNQKFLDQSDFLRLVRNLNSYQNIYRICHNVSSFTEKIYSSLEQKLHKFFEDYGIGLKLANNTHGGCIIFVFASQRLRMKIFKAVEEISQELGENMIIDWVSWRDGLENKGVIVEQSLKNQIYSDFISRCTLQVLHLDKWGLHEDLYTLEEFSRVRKEMEVVLDSLKGEIWIKGEKITSKELRTATHTILTMRVLLENIKTEISKTKLPSSGYLKDRNEFQSKIATPLVKAIEKHLGRRVSFNVKGSIINFTVNFDPKDVEFYYIEKEF